MDAHGEEGGDVEIGSKSQYVEVGSKSQYVEVGSHSQYASPQGKSSEVLLDPKDTVAAGAEDWTGTYVEGDDGDLMY